MSKIRKIWKRNCEIGGWVLFIVSALFFIAASIRANDIIGFLGGLFFLVACFVFLIPYVFPGQSR